MRLKSMVGGWGAKVAALGMAAAVAVGVAVAVPQEAEAAHRDWLRPDATGHCDWDAAAYWVQRCDVYSPAMKRNITMQIQPAKNGGNAGLYMLDGLRATNVSNAWISEANMQRTFVDNNMTLVMPVGGESSFYSDWKTPSSFNRQGFTYKWETFLTRELPVYLERNFGVARNNNSILGLSMGGSAAFNLGGWHRDQFKQIISLSGYLQTTAPGMRSAIRLALLDAGGFDVDAMWGPPWDPTWMRNDPMSNIENYRGMSLFLSSAPGVPGQHDHPADLQQHFNTFNGVVLEGLARASHIVFSQELNRRGIAHTDYYDPAGIHSWPYWRDVVNNRAKPFILNHMNGW